MASLLHHLEKAAKHEAFTHLLVLAICGGALSLAIVLKPPPVGQEAVGISGVPIPKLCTFNSVTDVPCPGCGLTRSWVTAFEGQIQRSWHYNRMGMVLILFSALQCVRHGLWLLWRSGRTKVERAGGYLDRSLVVIGVLLLVNWAFVLYDFFF